MNNLLVVQLSDTKQNVLEDLLPSSHRNTLSDQTQEVALYAFVDKNPFIVYDVAR